MGTLRKKGRMGESVAMAFLQERGLTLLAQNVQCGFGEIDLVAQDGDVIVFVEVKSRSSTTFGLPQEAVTSTKQKRLTKLAYWYLKRHKLENRPARFDVIAVLWDEHQPHITWIKDAFEATR